MSTLSILEDGIMSYRSIGRKVSESLIFVSCLIVISGCGSGTGSNGEKEDEIKATPTPTVQIQDAKIKETVENFKTALESNTLDTVVEQFTPDTQSKYKEFFEQNPSAKSDIAKAMETAKLELITPETQDAEGNSQQIGELSVVHDGVVYHVIVIKKDGVWKISSL
jgi:hypothetical protein